MDVTQPSEKYSSFVSFSPFKITLILKTYLAFFKSIGKILLDQTEDLFNLVVDS